MGVVQSERKACANIREIRAKSASGGAEWKTVRASQEGWLA